MFTIIDVKYDENSGFNSIIRSLNSIKKKKVYAKPLTLRQNMRDNLSNENMKRLFILSLKNYLNQLKVVIVNSFLMTVKYRIFKARYVQKMI